MTNQPVVLYVEDDLQSRKVMRMILERRMGLPYVTILENSADFPDVVSALSPKPDIVFLDIHMEPYNGFQMLEMLRSFEWSRKLPIVALTASVMNEEIHQLRTAGFDGCLAKPIDLSTFSELFSRLVAGEMVWRITV